MTVGESPRDSLIEVHDRLLSMHAFRGWHWSESTDPFEIIVGAILVQNTAWANVEKALDNLRRADALSVEFMRAISSERLRELIRPSGQYRQKARKIEAFLELERECGSLPELLAMPAVDLRSVLLGTWGIGPETADVIILYAAHKRSFVIDAYTRRLFGRLGIGPEEAADYGTWQAFFEGELPMDVALWGRYHSLIVLHCKHLCTKRSPHCGECELAPRCPASEAGPSDG